MGSFQMILEYPQGENSIQGLGSVQGSSAPDQVEFPGISSCLASPSSGHPVPGPARVRPGQEHPWSSCAHPATQHRGNSALAFQPSPSAHGFLPRATRTKHSGGILLQEPQEFRLGMLFPVSAAIPRLPDGFGCSPRWGSSDTSPCAPPARERVAELLLLSLQPWLPKAWPSSWRTGWV